MDLKDEVGLFKSTSLRVSPAAAQSAQAFLDELFSRKSEFLAADRYRGIADADQFYTKIVGVSFEGRQTILHGLREGDQLQFRREPENPFDANAIAVCFGALQLGYIKRDVAKHLAPVLDEGRRYRLEVASLTGGGSGRSIGVNILITRNDMQLYAGALAVPSDEAVSFEDIQRALIGERRLRDRQIAVIERVLARKRTLAVLGTGRGKSLCFQLPAALFARQRGQKTVVLYPLRALANDQFEALRLRLGPCGVRVLRANGSIDSEERELLNQALLNGDWDILLTTPEFVQYHGHRLAQDLNRPSFVVIDEAHHVYEARHRPAYAKIAQFLELVGNPAVLALTATARQECFDELVRVLNIEAWVIDPSVRENLTVVDARGTKDRLAYLREQLTDSGKAIIYCNSRNEATKVAELLRVSMPLTAFYHAGVPTEQRLEIEARFRSGEIQIVVATSAFGEGIDLPDVRNVVLYHLNFNFTEFNQQAGRAGRDGAPANIHLLYGDADRRINDFIISKSAPTLSVLRELYRGMRGLADERGELRMPYTEIARTLELDRADETTVSVAARIFAEVGLLSLQTDDDGRVLRFNPHPQKVDITATPRFAEGEAERENFERFCGVAMKAAAEDLERIINRPIYPSSTPHLR